MPLCGDVPKETEVNRTYIFVVSINKVQSLIAFLYYKYSRIEIKRSTCMCAGNYIILPIFSWLLAYSEGKSRYPVLRYGEQELRRL